MKTYLRRFTCLCAAALAAVLASGCSQSVLVELYNNTSSQLVVLGCDKPIAIQPRKVAEIRPHTCADFVQVTRGSESWGYRFWLPTHEVSEAGDGYYHRQRWNILDAAAVVRLQLNQDRKVFVLPNGHDFPASEEISQPLGFPWRPT